MPCSSTKPLLMCLEVFNMAITWRHLHVMYDRYGAIRIVHFVCVHVCHPRKHKHFYYETCHVGLNTFCMSMLCACVSHHIAVMLACPCPCNIGAIPFIAITVLHLSYAFSDFHLRLSVTPYLICLWHQF